MFIKLILLTGDNDDIETPSLVNIDVIESFRRVDGKTILYYKSIIKDDPSENSVNYVKESASEIVEILSKLQLYVK